MKNFIIATVLSGLAFVSSAQAEEKIDIILNGKPGGLVSRMVDIAESSLGDQFGERLTMKGCAPAVEYIKNTNKPTIAIGWPDMQVGEDNPCSIPKEMFYGYLGASSFSLCVKDENKEGAIDRLKNDDVIIGYSNWSWIRHQSEIMVPEINSKAKAVPYKNSASLRTALAAGEVDFSITTTSGDGEWCPVILAPDLADGAIATGKDLFPNSKIAGNFAYSVYLLGANIPQNKDLANLILASDAWKNRKDIKYKDYLVESDLDDQFAVLNGN